MRKTLARTILSAALLASGSLYFGGALAETTRPQAGDYSADGQWIKMHGPEGGWAPAPHRYEFENGKLVHVDPLDRQQRVATSDTGFTSRGFTPRQYGPVD